ncbi:MAG: hypothetical protein ACRDS9_11825 [Pseudonocardiaceae bacterium]
MPYEEGADPELRQVTTTASGLAFAVELGTAKAKNAQVIALLCQGRKVAELRKLRLPVGGARMRPCLEDLLQLLIEEFRFDSVPGAINAIEDGRVRWRRRQLAAMVRDDPEEAARVLVDELHYEVKPPISGAHGVRFDRLRRW